MNKIINDISSIINSKNKNLTYDVLNNIFNKYNINYRINSNIELFIEALTHPSYSLSLYNFDNYNYNHITNTFKKSYPELYRDNVFIKENNYERLEFLGDSFVKPILSSYLYFRYPAAKEGFMSKLRTKLESTKTLSLFFEHLGLKPYILLSSKLEDEDGRDNIKIMEDCFEAFIGALYVYGINYNLKNNSSQIYDIIKNLIINLIETEINLTELIVERNYKDELNRYCHREKINLPNYKVSHINKEFIKSHNKVESVYYVIVEVDNKVFGPCSAISKKDAEQMVAKLAIYDFENNDEEDGMFVF